MRHIEVIRVVEDEAVSEDVDAWGRLDVVGSFRPILDGGGG